MAREREALESRGIRVVAISKDSAATSKAFAKRSGIWFPLIADEDLSISRDWVGVSTGGYSTPGTFVISPERQVIIRQIGTSKDDRLYTEELIARIDAHMPPKAGVPDLLGGFSPIHRWQFRFAAGGEGAPESDIDPGGSISVEGLAPLGRHVLVGASSTLSLAPSSAVDVGPHLRLRLPFGADLFEASLDIPAGLSIQLGETSHIGLQAGTRLGVHFAIYPSLAAFLDTGVIYRHFFVDGASVRQPRLSTRVGLTWLPEL